MASSSRLWPDGRQSTFDDTNLSTKYCLKVPHKLLAYWSLELKGNHCSWRQINWSVLMLILCSTIYIYKYRTWDLAQGITTYSLVFYKFFLVKDLYLCKMVSKVTRLCTLWWKYKFYACHTNERTTKMKWWYFMRSEKKSQIQHQRALHFKHD